MPRDVHFFLHLTSHYALPVVREYGSHTLVREGRARPKDSKCYDISTPDCDASRTLRRRLESTCSGGVRMRQFFPKITFFASLSIRLTLFDIKYDDLKERAPPAA